MIQFVQGDMFQSECEAYCNPVNCIGIMGKGLALVFKNKYPDMFKEYKVLCKDGILKPGSLHMWRNPHNDPKWIINFPTKTDLSPSKLEYISSGLVALREKIIQHQLKTLAIPSLGCGCGKLSWDLVKKEIELALLDNADPIVDKCLIKVYKPF